jgi:serine/threonine-protein kinase
MLKEPTPEAPLPFGRYQLIRRIGAGGMGEVFLAREGGPSPRACVVKKVLPNLIANRAFVGRFIDEAKVVVRLKHPHIARVYAMGEVDGEYYLAMEYVQGKTVSRFARRLRDRKIPLPLGVALFLTEKVCEGLAYAHAARDEAGHPLELVHRDLSPANVCVSYAGEVKIIDFGAAQSTLKAEQTAPRVVIGNLTYMAPEQAKKQRVDGRADVYSCGVMLWELLVGTALPQTGDAVERWRKAANPVWEPPSALNPSVPQDVDAVVLKALAKAPSDRYPTAAAFAEALGRARQRHAPKLSERDLGALLSRAFSKEKTSEDEVLHEAVYGRTVSTSESARHLSVVPPTALAFEHTAVLAPADFVPPDKAITDPERLDPTLGERKAESDPSAQRPPGLKPRTQDPDVHPARTSFGVTFDELPPVQPGRSLLREIEAVEGPEGGVSDFDRHTSAYPAKKRWWRAGLLVGVFLGAAGLGFLVVWLAVR